MYNIRITSCHNMTSPSFFPNIGGSQVPRPLRRGVLWSIARLHQSRQDQRWIWRLIDTWLVVADRRWIGAGRESNGGSGSTSGFPPLVFCWNKNGVTSFKTDEVQRLQHWNETKVTISFWSCRRKTVARDHSIHSPLKKCSKRNSGIKKVVQKMAPLGFPVLWGKKNNQKHRETEEL